MRTISIVGSRETLNASLELDNDAYHGLINPDTFGLPAKLEQVVVKTEDVIYAKSNICVKGKPWSSIKIEVPIND